MNIESGTSLAVFQDQLIARYNQGGTISSAEMSRLKGNLWVETAATTAPNNLVVRHWCLIDLFSKTNTREQKIVNLLYTISSSGLWLEGYSYYMYTKMALTPYAKKFNSKAMTEFMTSADIAFSRSAYIGIDGKKWPAPFGDLRKGPLEPEYQSTTMVDPCDYGFLKRVGSTYTISARYLGCNTHTPKDSVVKIVGGQPMVGSAGFKWYEGYDNKYPSKTAEIIDTIGIKRLFSIFRR
jgi:hypothetical protein